MNPEVILGFKELTNLSVFKIKTPETTLVRYVTQLFIVIFRYFCRYSPVIVSDRDARLSHVGYRACRVAQMFGYLTWGDIVIPRYDAYVGIDGTFTRRVVVHV